MAGNRLAMVTVAVAAQYSPYAEEYDYRVSGYGQLFQEYWFITTKYL